MKIISTYEYNKTKRKKDLKRNVMSTNYFNMKTKKNTYP